MQGHLGNETIGRDVILSPQSTSGGPYGASSQTNPMGPKAPSPNRGCISIPVNKMAAATGLQVGTREEAIGVF